MMIGLTGGIGSGKSTVAQYFRELGIFIINTDEIAKQLLTPEQPMLQKVVEHFGEEILEKNGTLNRTKLRMLVFKSTADRQWLETRLHPRIKEKVLEYANAQKSKRERAPYFIVEIPLLIEAHFEDVVDRILVVDCPRELQIMRIKKRDATPLNVIEDILKTQTDRKTRLEKADEVIENSADLATLKNKVLALHQYYVSRGSSLDKDSVSTTV